MDISASIPIMINLLDSKNRWEKFIWWEKYFLAGLNMSAIVKVDEKGRVVIPKRIREKVKLKEGNYVNVKAKGKTIVMEPLESIADKYYGAFKVSKWPKDLDEFIVEVTNRWWTSQAM